MSDDCTESYRDCMRSRQERVRLAIEANPEASNRQIADRAGVSYQAVNNYKNKTDNALSSAETEKAFPPPAAVKFRDLYDPNENYWSHRRVHEVHLALNRCSPAEAAFLYAKGLAKLSRNFIEGVQRHDDDVPTPRPAFGYASEDPVGDA